MIAIVSARKENDLFVVSPAIRVTSLSMGKALKEYSKHKIYKSDDDHLIALEREEVVHLFLTDKSPWYSFIDTNPFWSSSQIKSFNKLIEMLLACDEYDPFTFEL